MIRRSPTRVELKLEDLADFDYIQKFEKKKAPNAVPGLGGISAADAQKFIRQDRIGFRPIRAGATTGSGGNGGCYAAGSNSTGSSAAVDVVPGVTTAEASTFTIEGQGGEVTGTSTSGNAAATNRSASNVADMDVSGDDGEAVTPSNITGESNVSNVDMSLDESL